MSTQRTRLLALVGEWWEDHPKLTFVQAVHQIGAKVTIPNQVSPFFADEDALIEYLEEYVSAKPRGS